MTKLVQLELPEEAVQYVSSRDERDVFARNAMLLYPFIRNETISHGRAAQILGVSKIELIEFYSGMGISYFDLTEDELDEDVRALNKLGSAV